MYFLTIGIHLCIPSILLTRWFSACPNQVGFDGFGVLLPNATLAVEVAYGNPENHTLWRDIGGCGRHRLINIVHVEVMMMSQLTHVVVVTSLDE